MCRSILLAKPINGPEKGLGCGVHHTGSERGEGRGKMDRAQCLQLLVVVRGEGRKGGEKRFSAYFARLLTRKKKRDRSPGHKQVPGRGDEGKGNHGEGRYRIACSVLKSWGERREEKGGWPPKLSPLSILNAGRKGREGGEGSIRLPDQPKRP